VAEVSRGMKLAQVRCARVRPCAINPTVMVPPGDGVLQDTATHVADATGPTANDGGLAVLGHSGDQVVPGEYGHTSTRTVASRLSFRRSSRGGCCCPPARPRHTCW
jgi:hypothetical protein